MSLVNKRRLTVIIVPRHDQKTVSFSLPTYVPHIVGGTLVVVALAGALLLGSYRGLLSHDAQRSGQVKAMRRVNAEQKIQIEVLAIKSQGMAQDMAKIKVLDQEVQKLIGSPGRTTDKAPVAAVTTQTLPTPAESTATVQMAQADAMLTRPETPEVGRGSIDRNRQLLAAALTVSTQLDQIKGELGRQLPELLVAKGKIEVRLDYIRHRPTGWPVWGPVTSPFGWRTSPFNTGVIDFHPGIDIACPIGTPIEATADGTVIHVAYDSSYGKLVIVDHLNGLVSYYAHLSTYAVDVGDKVTRGQVVGYSGNTGASTGPHLHYEIRQWGKSIDPEPYFDAPPAQEG